MMDRFLQRLLDLRLRFQGSKDGRLQAGMQTVLDSVQQRGLAGKARVERPDGQPCALEHALDREQVQLLFTELVLCRRQYSL